MKMRLTALAVAVLALGPLSQAGPVELDYKEKKHRHDVFSATDPSLAYYSYEYRPYLEWSKVSSGQYFPMDIAPVLTGMAAGQPQAPAPRGVNPSSYEDHAREFAEVVNFKNDGGRPVLDLGTTSVEAALKEKRESTHVVEMVLSAVIETPLDQIDLSSEAISSMAEDIDPDHYHYQIPGDFVAEALEEGHSALSRIDSKKNYLLSVFDLRLYDCAVMKIAIDEYFSKNSDKEKLQNGSIYVISNVVLNDASDLEKAAKYFGRKPDAIVTQETIFADHLIRGAKTIFAFYSEGRNTRVVLLSNVAMGSKFFTGLDGMAKRQYLLGGMGGGLTGAALSAADAVVGAKDILAEMISGATADMREKNSCDRGLALGLIQYSQALFTGFANFTAK